ncbi:hypothetical protein B0H66DRAFT_644926 [Apodospora peruviana]|uniref:Uncharacterized protein n=1 Tax=Apodospora peruviana TaxID=516989 RepID=A0AAE0HSG4_9PEZI|nr:hypothetical protein B0H66DRAFT_644926 [Apodospora peruviana]
MKDDSRQTGQEEAADAERSIRTQRRFGVWKPSLAIGSSLSVEGEDLSRIEMADRKIIQRRTWLEFYGNTGYFPELLEKAISERTQLDENDEENTLPISSLASTHKRAIEERVGVLCETGAIPYSDSYTLIWGGSIVDTCPDYGSFTRDRSARLDRYLQEHGGGWLWYEPPLKDEIGGRGPSVINSRSPASPRRLWCLDNTESWRKKTETMGHYRLEWDFADAGRRRKQSPSPTPTARASSGKSSSTARHPPLPLLLVDLPLLRINPKTYAAQTAKTVATIDKPMSIRCYELDVGVFTSSSSSSHPRLLLPTTNLASEPDILGATVPVFIFDTPPGLDFRQ